MIMIDFAEMEKSKEALQGACLCPSCPSWVSCGEKAGFCIPSVGKSRCIKKENGCLCPACPVAEKMKLEHDYYCTRGSEKEQK